MLSSIEAIFSHNSSRWSRLIVLAGIVIGLFFGTWGYLIYGEGQTSFLTAVYHAVQLFVLHMPLLEKPINLPLEIGRWAAATSAGLMVVLVLRRAFLTEWGLFHMLWGKNHVVVCGLGEVGTRLALEFGRAGRKVV